MPSEPDSALGRDVSVDVIGTSWTFISDDEAASAIRAHMYAPGRGNSRGVKTFFSFLLVASFPPRSQVKSMRGA